MRNATPYAKRWAAIAMVAALVGLSACGGDDDAASGGDGVEVSSAWARATPEMAEAGAAYMVLSSDDGDRLVGASVSSEVAGLVELHETVAAEDTATTMAAMGGSETTGSGMEGMGEMMMREVAGIDVPAGGQVALEPGGYHVMLLELPRPLEDGTSFELTLDFEKAGTVNVDVPVREEPPE